VVVLCNFAFKGISSTSMLVDLTPVPEPVVPGSEIRGIGTRQGPTGSGSKSGFCSIF